MASTLVRLVSRNDGTYSVHHSDTGRVLMELQKIDHPALERRADVAPDLEDQVETAKERREQERSQEMLAGLFLGLAVVAGFALGWLAFHH